jgi:hypothetical protein
MEKMKAFGRTMHGWKDNTKIYLTEIVSEDVI